jgi:hypothetical protein
LIGLTLFEAGGADALFNLTAEKFHFFRVQPADRASKPLPFINGFESVQDVSWALCISIHGGVDFHAALIGLRRIFLQADADVLKKYAD